MDFFLGVQLHYAINQDFSIDKHSPNAYYNYRKHRKADYYAHRDEVLIVITDVYHKHHGVTGYRSIQVYLKREGISYSRTTVHKYMNRLLGLKSIVRPKKTDYKHGEAHKVFENKIKKHLMDGCTEE